MHERIFTGAPRTLFGAATRQNSDHAIDLSVLRKSLCGNPFDKLEKSRPRSRGECSGGGTVTPLRCDDVCDRGPPAGDGRARGGHAERS